MAEQLLARQERVSHVVREYTRDFPTRVRSPTSTRVQDGDVVLVTGSTGSLGCYLLTTLLLSPNVRRVYALNRQSRHGLKDRQRNALIERGLDGDIVDSNKLVLLIGDIAEPMMGLPLDVYTEVGSFTVSRFAELI